MTTYRVPRAIALLALATMFSACHTTRPRDETVGDPNQEVAEIERLWTASSTGGATSDSSAAASNSALRRRAESVLFQYPSHAPALMLCAVLAYEAGEPIIAQRHLDDLLVTDPAHADAVCLRARIALEEGNTGYARRLLDERIALRPDHAGLREVLGAVLYLTGDLKAAQASLTEADRLGAPHWRTAYDRGLVAESEGQMDEAARFYREALAARPNWNAPRLRMRGMGSGEVAAGAVPPRVVEPAPAVVREPSVAGPAIAPPVPDSAVNPSVVRVPGVLHMPSDPPAQATAPAPRDVPPAPSDGPAPIREAALPIGSVPPPSLPAAPAK